MGVGESLKKGFSVTIHSWGAILIFFLYGLLTNLANAKVSARLQNAVPGMNPTFLAAVGATLLFIAIGVYFQAGLVGYVRDRFEGNPKLSKFWAYGLKYYPWFLVLAIMILLIVVAVFLFGLLLLSFLQNDLRPIAITIITLAAIGALYGIALLLFVPYAIVCDNLSFPAAVSKSARLTVKNMGAIVLIGLVLVLFGFSGGLILGVLLGLVSVLIPGANNSQYLVTGLSSIVNALVAVLMAATYMTLYKRADSASASR
ncbi:MAG TPA: hypothetical protein VL404_02940 [Candidatus Eisenbacteria bacterium]|nr:hypothetical protein [Candidatus Eisenbacteria bacterium]